MKKKPLMIMATTLIALLVLPPIAHAGVVHFWWDNVYFVAGTDIDYAHPDNVYYGISPSSDWTRLGDNLYHNQINRDTTYAIVIGASLFIDIVALILGAKLGGSSTAYYVGGLAAIVISTVISMAIDYFFIDERGCIWWWISWLFLYYLYKNLPYLSGIGKEVALAEILAAFVCFGYIRVGMVTFHDPMGIGQPYYSGGGGGGGCPYVYTWDGEHYVMDNNLLPASEMSNGADVEDYYKLEQTLVPTYEGRLFSFYSLKIREFEHEHSYLDHVKLLAVDHSSNVDVAVSPYGEILTYGNLAPPITAVDDGGIDVLSKINSIDENYYQGYNGSHITLTFAPTDISNGVKLVIREDGPLGPPLLKCPIYVQILNETGEWNTVATFHTRTYWATDILNMAAYLPDAQGQLKVRFCFISNDKIDYLGLDTTPQASIEIHQAFFLSAFHSTQGNVKPLLMENDQTYAELIPGEQIQLAFLPQNSQNEKRTFILYTEGHYNTITP